MSEGPPIHLGGLTFVPDLTGALFCPDFNAVIAADLHFEKGSSHARRGIHLPPHDTSSSLDGLERVLSLYQPQRLILLGDNFHDTNGPERLQTDARTRIKRLSDKVDVCWITGNHDPFLPDDLGGTIASEIVLGPVTLRHEPEVGSQGEIAGHLHPVATIAQRGRRLRRRCFIANADRLILPAFGAFTGGLNVTDKAFAPLFPDKTFNVWMIGRDGIYRFASRRIVANAP